MQRIVLHFLACAICLPLAPGCSSPRRSEPIAGPLPIASAEVAAGREVFMLHCHKCHPGGAGGLGPGINDKPLPAALIRFQVRQGLGVMPGFSRAEISAEELDDLVVYLQALRRHR